MKVLINREESMIHLVNKIQEGDKEAFNELIIGMEKELYKVARMRLNNIDDINDAVQETIIQAYKSIKKIKEPQYFKTWIIRVLINNCNKIYRKLSKEKNIEYKDEIINDTYSIYDVEKVKDIDFYILIEQLNYKERITLILYYLLEFNSKEIGLILKEPESTIRSRILRTKEKLRVMLEEDGKIGKNRI